MAFSFKMHSLILKNSNMIEMHAAKSIFMYTLHALHEYIMYILYADDRACLSQTSILMIGRNYMYICSNTYY